METIFDVIKGCRDSAKNTRSKTFWAIHQGEIDGRQLNEAELLELQYNLSFLDGRIDVYTSLLDHPLNNIKA